MTWDSSRLQINIGLEMYAFDIWLMCDYEKCANSCQKVPIMFILCLASAKHDIFCISKYSGFYEDNEDNDIYAINVHLLARMCL